MMRWWYLFLAVLVLVVGIPEVAMWERYHVASHNTAKRLEINRSQLEEIGRYLRDYRKVSGRYPANDEGLLAVPILKKACYGDSWPHESGKWIYMCRVNDTGILSLWGEPFIYENRADIPVEKYRDSGATIDIDRNYSVRVDKDVYIWSLGAQNAYKYYTRWQPMILCAYIVLGLAGTLFVILFIVETVRSVGREYTGLRHLGSVLLSIAGGGVFSAVMAAIIFPMAVRSCYEYRISIDRSPRLTKDYKTLIAKYHERGVISDKAYKKMQNALERDESNERVTR